MAIMKALTIYQPWATLVAIGAKPYEFRGWTPPRALIGERIAIHAAARPMKPSEVRDLLNGLVNPAEYRQPCLHADIALPFLQRISDGHYLKIPNALPLSHIMCTAVLGEPKRGGECAREFGEEAGNDSDPRRHLQLGMAADRHRADDAARTRARLARLLELERGMIYTHFFARRLRRDAARPHQPHA